jgi:arginine exporter protein ArgO
MTLSIPVFKPQQTLSKEDVMKSWLIIVGLACLLAMGIYGCNETSSERSAQTSNRLNASAEKQIKNFNQSTQKDRKTTGGPPAGRTISGLNGQKVD